MAHYVRIIKKTNNAIVAQDLGLNAQANSYTSQNYPEGITAQDISFEATCDAAILAEVTELQAQVDVDENGVTVTLANQTNAQARAAKIASAKSALSGVEASGLDAATKGFLVNIRDTLWPDGSADPA